MKTSWKIPVVAGIVMVVLNVVLFVIPFHKTVTFWISDVAVVLAIAAQIPIADIALKKGSGVTSKVYGWPIASVGFRYLCAITLSAIIFILLSGNIANFPVWVAIVVYTILYGAAAIGLITADSARNFVEKQDVKLEDKTLFMRKLYIEMESLKESVSDREMSAMITKLAEKVRFSDPTSNEALFEQEGTLYATFGELKEAIKEKNKDSVRTVSQRFEEQLETRNRMCKFAKRGH